MASPGAGILIVFRSIFSNPGSSQVTNPAQQNAAGSNNASVSAPHPALNAEGNPSSPPAVHLPRRPTHPDVLELAGGASSGLDARTNAAQGRAGNLALPPTTYWQGRHNHLRPRESVQTTAIMRQSAPRTARLAMSSAVDRNDHQTLITLSHTLEDQTSKSMAGNIPLLLGRAIRQNKSSG
jgi:hypothetical protein